MLDAHNDIRCGEETRVVPRILQLAAQWNRSAKESSRLHEAGLTDQVFIIHELNIYKKFVSGITLSCNFNPQIIGDAVASFIMEVVVKHGEPGRH